MWFELLDGCLYPYRGKRLPKIQGVGVLDHEGRKIRLSIDGKARCLREAKGQEFPSDGLLTQVMLIAS